MHFTGSIPSRYFTPDEANNLLPEIRAYLIKAHEHTRGISDLEYELAECHDQQLEGQLSQKLEIHRAGLSRLLERIKEIGAEVKALDTGRVDFPAVRNGEQVRLSWKLGEPKVEHWQPMHSNFVGRQPLIEDRSVRWHWRN